MSYPVAVGIIAAVCFLGFVLICCHWAKEPNQDPKDGGDA